MQLCFESFNTALSAPLKGFVQYFFTCLPVPWLRASYGAPGSSYDTPLEILRPECSMSVPCPMDLEGMCHLPSAVTICVFLFQYQLFKTLHISINVLLRFHPLLSTSSSPHQE